MSGVLSKSADKASTSKSSSTSSLVTGKRSKSSTKRNSVSKKVVEESPTSPPSEERKRGKETYRSEPDLSDSPDGKLDSPDSVVQILFEGSKSDEAVASLNRRPLDPELIDIGNKVKDLMGISNQAAQLDMAAEIYRKIAADKPNAFTVQVADIYPQYTLVPGAQSDFGQTKLSNFEARASRYLHEGALIEHSLDVARIDDRFVLVNEKAEQIPQCHDLYRSLFEKH